MVAIFLFPVLMVLGILMHLLVAIIVGSLIEWIFPSAEGIMETLASIAPLTGMLHAFFSATKPLWVSLLRWMLGLDRK